MNRIIKFADVTERDEFIRSVASSLADKLPPGLCDLEISHRAGDGWMIMRYPQIKSGHYELHFSSHSKSHAAYFGDEPVEVLAFYYRGTHKKRKAWVKAIQSFIDPISHQLGQKVVCGLWGESQNWAWLAINLTPNNFDLDIELYANAVALFIQATFAPIWYVIHTVRKK